MPSAPRICTDYEVHTVKALEQAEEVDDFYKYQSESKSALWSKFSNSKNGLFPLSNAANSSASPQPVRSSAITRVVSPCPHIGHFDDQVEVVDSVVIDHVSEDDRSVSSEEVTFERWTEETRLIKTKVFKDGYLVDEFVQRTSPELVGNILREKLIERHEHIKHISQVNKLSIKIINILYHILNYCLLGYFCMR